MDFQLRLMWWVGLLSFPLLGTPYSAFATEADGLPPLVKSTASGSWSNGATWVGGKTPASGDRVQVLPGHTVLYDRNSNEVIRSVHVSGTLTFAADRDTRLDVGLIKVQPGIDACETGFDCEADLPAIDPKQPRATLSVGTQHRPIDAAHTATIRLVYVEGHDKQSCPAVVCCGGKMEFHGAPLSRTWVKLGDTVAIGATQLTLAEPVTGWRVGDRVILTSTSRQIKLKKTFTPSVRDKPGTEERLITAIDGVRLTLDKPLDFEHLGTGEYRGEVANLSRNVVIESADPDKARGHTMYHRNSAGSISYVEFRHLGKPGVLGRYSLHFHLAGDSMRGSSVIGASIWDSGNRWITIHGTNYLVVRDCVGYRSLGHGFFLEDGTEVFNVLDRNLAVQAFSTQPLPNQVLPYDKNDGSGYWWANSQNTFTRNVAAECDEYGYFFQVVKSDQFDPVLAVSQPNGVKRKVDIRTLPFVRFEGNEAHTQRRHSINLGGRVGVAAGDVAGVGPDAEHPFVLRNTKLWDIHWAFHALSPSVMVDGMDVFHGDYGLWRNNYTQHAYRGIKMADLLKPEFMPQQGTKPTEESFPQPLKPVDDLPPTTVVTSVLASTAGKVTVRGVTSDNGVVKRVMVNDVEAQPAAEAFGAWEATLDAPTAGPMQIAAFAEDEAGNREPRPHTVIVSQ